MAHENKIVMTALCCHTSKCSQVEGWAPTSSCIAKGDSSQHKKSLVQAQVLSRGMQPSKSRGKQPLDQPKPLPLDQPKPLPQKQAPLPQKQADTKTHARLQARASPRVAAKPKKNHSRPPELVSSSESGSSSGSDSAPSPNKRKPIAVTPEKKKKPRGPSSARLDEQLQEVHAENVGASLTTSARLQRKMDAQMRLNEVCYAGLTNCRTPACSESWTPSSN